MFNRLGYIDAVRGPSICAVDIRGLLKVVPAHGAGDKEGEYCINGFAIDRYTDLLTERDRMYPDMCTRTSFAKTHQLVSTSVPVACNSSPIGKLYSFMVHCPVRNAVVNNSDTLFVLIDARKACNSGVYGCGSITVEDASWTAAGTCSTGAGTALCDGIGMDLPI